MLLICGHICASHALPSGDPKIKFQELKDLKGNGKYCNERKQLLNVKLNQVIPDELHLILAMYHRCTYRGFGKNISSI